jgi:Protein of unknown function (DUF2752)
MRGIISNQERAASRWGYLAVTLASGATLIVARLLDPSPSGIGTHQQLGLPPCPFLAFTGWPCPACGLTTSFAYAAHLDFQLAFHTQPFGFLLFWLTLACIPLSLYMVWRPIDPDLLLRNPWSARLVYLLLVLCLLGWGYKIRSMI